MVCMGAVAHGMRPYDPLIAGPSSLRAVPKHLKIEPQFIRKPNLNVILKNVKALTS